MPPGSNPPPSGSPAPPGASPYPPYPEYPPYPRAPSPYLPPPGYPPAPSPAYRPHYGQPPFVPWWTTVRPPIERRRWIPVLAIAAIIAAIVLGGVVLDRAIAAPSIGTIDIGNGATIEGAPGWVRIDDPTDAGAIALEKGDARLIVAGYTGLGANPRSILEAYVRDSETSSDNAQITFGSIESRTIGGRPAATVAFTAVASVAIDGEVVVIVAGRVAVVLEAVAPAGDLQPVAGDIVEMAAGLKVTS